MTKGYDSLYSSKSEARSRMVLYTSFFAVSLLGRSRAGEVRKNRDEHWNGLVFIVFLTTILLGYLP